MFPHTFTIVILLASTQPALRPGVTDAHVVAQITPAAQPISPFMPPISPVPNQPGFGRGRPWPIVPLPWYPGGVPFWGFGYQPPTVVIVPGPAPAPAGPPAPPERVIELSNEFPATLVLEFPAAAEIWVNGEKSDAKPSNEWTLTSPVLKPNEEFTFKVKARWTAGGKTYEAERSVAVAGGKRSRAIVVSGTEIK